MTEHRRRLTSLGLAELQTLERSVEVEVVAAACHGAPLGDLTRYLARVRARVAARESDLTPTLQRRQRLFAER
jgi:hypothetical protein